MALALSQQLEIEQDNTKGTSGPTKQGNNNGQKKINNNVTPTTNNYLLGGDSIYSNYLKGLSALDENNSNSLSSSMFDSILGGKTTSTDTSNITTNTTPVAVTSTFALSNHVSQVVLDSDISDSDEDSKISEDSEDDQNHKGRRQRMTKGVRPIMERRTPDNPVLVQRKIDNWSNRVDTEANTAESNESMIARMKDRHRNQVKLAALRNQQQQQEEYNMMGYPQHMVPQAYGPPSMLPISPISPTGAVLPHPGLMMDPAQMYYAHPVNNNNNNNNEYMETTVKTQPRSVPSAFLPNPTHLSLAIPHPPKEESEAPKVAVKPSPLTTQSNSNSRPNSSHARPPTAPPSSYASSKPNSSTSTLEQIDEHESRNTTESPLPMDTPSPVLEEMNAVGSDEADCEISADDERPPHANLPRKKKSTKKLRQNYDESVTRVDSGYTEPTVRSSRSTPNLKKKKSSRNSSRRNSQDLTSSPPSEMTVPTPPPVPNSPYLQYHPTHSEENLYHHAVPRSSSQHQLHYQQQQQLSQHQHRQSLRHMKSEPELPRRSNSHTTQQQYQQQQKYQHQQQQQLNAEWERMQNYHQRHSVMKPPSGPQQQQQQMPFMPMYPMYYPNTNQPMMMVDPNYSQPQQYDPYQGPAYNQNSQVTYQQQQQQQYKPYPYHSRQ